MISTAMPDITKHILTNEKHHQPVSAIYEQGEI
jgi:hypothetical protein